MEYFIGAYKKYADFYGRARRKEYWTYYLFYIIALVLLVFIDGFMGTLSSQSSFGLLSGIFLIASFIPTLAIGARRLHDTNRSGWWQLIMMIPIIGSIILLVFFMLKGNEGENRFGKDPLSLIEDEI